MNDGAAIATTSPWYGESHVCDLSEEDLAFIYRLGQKIVYLKGSVVHLDGDLIDAFIYIDSGLARYYVANDEGVEKTVYYTDRFISIECFFHGQPVHTNCVAEEELVVYKIDRSDAALLMARKNIVQLVVGALALKCRIVGWQVADLSLAKPIQRIARILCCYYFDSSAGANRPLLHQDIADMTGLHRVTVTNYLNELRKQGIIEQTKQKTWLIKDRQALQQLALDGV